MSRMLWLRVDGYPAGCLETADLLAALARRLAEAESALGRASRISPSDFDGLAAAAFRTRAAGLAGTTGSAAADTAGLGRALRELGRDLRDVEIVMDRLADRARPHLRVLPDRILAPERPRSFQEPGDAQAWQVWDELVALHADARRLEEEAHDTWRAAIARFTGDGALPLLPGIGLPLDHDATVGPHLP